MRKKKAWNMSNPLYRYLQKKSNSRRVTASVGTTMARRRRFGGVRRFGRRASRSVGNFAKKGLSGTVAPALYGSLRPSVVGLSSPVFSMLPFGQYNDEAGMLIASMIFENLGPASVRKTASMVKGIEAYELGKAFGAPLVSNVTSGMGLTNSSNSNSNFSI